MAVVAGAMEVYACVRRGEARRVPRQLLVWTGIPLAIASAAWWLATPSLPFWGQILVALALVTVLGPSITGLPTSRWRKRACWSCSSSPSRCTSR